ncbi:MAG: TIGR01777 family oxidoreductase [Anaerolineales bacterium]
MRILITGGTGLIGRALAHNLAAAKHEVIILTRDPEWVVGMPEAIRAVRWDGKTAHGWGELADGAGAIINLAGQSIAGESLPDILFTRWSKTYKERILNSRLNAGKAVTEAITAAKNKPALLLQASAVGFYGPRAAEPVDESTPAGSDFLAQVCQQWEQSTQSVEALGVRRIILRTGLVLAPKGGILPIMALPFRLFAGGPIGSGKQYIPWIHLQDEIGAIEFLLKHPQASGVYNLTAPQPLTNADFGRALGRALFRPAFFPTPAFALKLALGEKSTLVLDGQNAIPTRLQAQGYKFKFSDAYSALTDLLR